MQLCFSPSSHFELGMGSVGCCAAMFACSSALRALMSTAMPTSRVTRDDNTAYSYCTGRIQSRSPLPQRYPGLPGGELAADTPASREWLLPKVWVPL